MSHLEEWVTLKKMGHIWKNGSHLQKSVTLGRMGQSCKNGSQLEERVTLVKNGSHLEKWVTLGILNKFLLNLQTFFSVSLISTILLNMKSDLFYFIFIFRIP